MPERIVLLAGGGVSPGMIAVVDVSPGVPRLPPVVPEVRLGPTTFVPLFPLPLWELLCCAPTAPPTTPPIIRVMMMKIVVMPHLVRYHGAFFAT